MTYTIIESRSSAKLQDLVNSMMKIGWKPIGGVTFVLCMNETIWAQAMVSTIAPE